MAQSTFAFRRPLMKSRSRPVPCSGCWPASASPRRPSPRDSCGSSEQRRNEVRAAVEAHRAAQREEVRREEAAAGRRLTRGRAGRTAPAGAPAMGAAAGCAIGRIAAGRRQNRSRPNATAPRARCCRAASAPERRPARARRCLILQLGKSCLENAIKLIAACAALTCARQPPWRRVPAMGAAAERAAAVGHRHGRGAAGPAEHDAAAPRATRPTPPRCRPS